MLSVAVACSGVLANALRQRTLTFEDRVKAKEAIERIYYSHQLGTTEAFADAVPPAPSACVTRAFPSTSATSSSASQSWSWRWFRTGTRVVSADGRLKMPDPWPVVHRTRAYNLAHGKRAFRVRRVALRRR